MSGQQSKADLVAEHQANLPLPEDPPVASDWNPADARTVNVKAGERQAEIPTTDTSSTGLREPASTSRVLKREVQGEKLTVCWVTDPNASEIREGAGAIASDSLAAESTRAGRGFASNRDPLGVSGSNSTFANTSTSGATRLDPASDAEARMAQEDWAEEKKLEAASTSYPDAAGGQSKGLAVQNTEGSYSTGGSTSNAGTAPSCVNSQYVDVGGPKGKNLTEGGFESNDRKNASFNSEIGSKNDPGRLAEQKIARVNADAANGAGMPRQKGTIGDNTYETLGGDTSAERNLDPSSVLCYG